MVNVWVMPGNGLGRMCDVELNWSAATRLQIDEQESIFRSEEVARVRLTVKELLGGATVLDLPTHVSQRVTEELAVGIGKLGGTPSVSNERACLCNAICEVRCRHVDLSHPRMEPHERVRVRGRRSFSSRHRFVVGPEGDREAVTHVDPWLYPWLKGNGGASRCCEPLRQLNFELDHPLTNMGDPRNDVTRQQAQCELVRVLKHDRVIGPQVTC